MNITTEKKKRILIVLLALLLALLVVGAVIMTSIKNKGGKEVDGDTSSSTTSQDDTSSVDSKPDTSSDNQTSDTSSEENTPSEPDSKPESEPEPEPEPEPVVKTDAKKILNKALSNLKTLKGDSKEVSEVLNPATITLEVNDTEEVDQAASQILNTIKSVLKYNEDTADGTVAVGQPNPFSYDYKLTYTETKNGKYIFNFEYRFRQYYKVTDKGYDTNGFVEEIVKYLTEKGKVKFDYQTTSGVQEMQPVIILLEDDYQTALEKAKGQVNSVCKSYRNFDFAYNALTVAGRGQEEKTALMFYIYCK